MNLTKERVNGQAAALEYMTECTLTTVADCCCTSRPKVEEFSRQINIAQNGIAWLMEYGRSESDVCQRVDRIINEFDGKVKRWAIDIRKKFYPDNLTSVLHIHS